MQPYRKGKSSAGYIIPQTTMTAEQRALLDGVYNTLKNIVLKNEAKIEGLKRALKTDVWKGLIHPAFENQLLRERYNNTLIKRVNEIPNAVSFLEYLYEAYKDAEVQK